jgi:radical SAM superfamily enzyme YgiQ (UPF0313 family)
VPNRTPTQIQNHLDGIMHRLDLPAQYFGDEPNSYRKDWDLCSTRWCIMASWPYEAAAGNQSIPAVYKAINIGREDFLCDRFYLPATPRDLRAFSSKGYPIFGIESKHQLMDFDVVATSIAYPILTMSFHQMLKMSDIPVRWKDREAKGLENFPMVMVGGQAYGAPEVLAPIIDCFWLGEVEDEPGNPGIAEVTLRISQFKEQGLWQADRLECYRRLALEFNFLYFPRFIDVQYDYEDRTHVNVGVKGGEEGDAVLSKQVVSYTSNLEGMRLPFLKRIVKNMDAAVPLDNPPLLYSDPGMGAGDLEVGRGCPAWCSFCALTYRQKPYRQHSVEFMVDFAKSYQDNMGSTRLAPFMPDFPMHTQRKELIASLLEQVSDEVDAPAMRIDDFNADQDFILLQVHGGMDGVTLGLEGNSQRMRDLVGKGTADEDVVQAVTVGIRAGLRKFKLFMISNLPGEDEGDVFRILKLAKKLADVRDGMNQPNVRIQFSWTPLLIEANTPFQWFAPPANTRALGDVWEEFRDLKIDFKLGGKAEPNKASFFQLCQRASREVGEAIVDAMDEIDQACWGGVPKTMRETLDKKLREHGFKNGFDDCFDERFKQDLFGWEFIDQGVSTELLWVTYLQMREFVEQTDSHTYDLKFDDQYHGNEWVERCDTRCYGKTCGVCDFDDLKQRTTYIRAAQRERDIDLSTIIPVDQKSQAFKVRAKLVKSERYRLIGNDHWRFNVRRAAMRAQRALGLAHGITKRSIKFASDDVKYKDWTCGVDYLEFGMTRRMTLAQTQAFIDAMNVELCAQRGDESTRWLDIQDWTIHPGTSSNMRTDIDLSMFELELEVEPSKVLAALERWEQADYVKMVLKQDAGYFAPGSEEVNAKDYVDSMWLARKNEKLVIRMLVRGRPSPYVVYAALMGKASWLDVAEKPAFRIDSFVPVDKNQQDMFRPSCLDCEEQIPTNVLDKPYHPERCPRCLDLHEGVTFKQATYS